MFGLITSIYQQFLYFLSPPFCYVCKKSLNYRATFCDLCKNKIGSIPSCSIDLSSDMKIKVLSASAYCDPLKKLVMAKSWSDRNASRELGKIMWEQTQVSSLNFDFVVPIPLHWSRYAYRGFNQAWEIGNVISCMSGKPMADILYRKRRTIFQSYMTPIERRDNVKSVFATKALNEETKYYEKKFLLVDDVMTTGSTLKAAASALIKLRPTAVTAVVGCRVVRQSLFRKG